MYALPRLPVAQFDRRQVDTGCYLRRETDTRRRRDFDFFGQLDCLDTSDLSSCISEELEGAD